MNNSAKHKGGGGRGSGRGELQMQPIGSVLDKSNFCLFPVMILCGVEVIIVLMLIFLKNGIWVATALCSFAARHFLPPSSCLKSTYAVSSTMYPRSKEVCAKCGALLIEA